MNTGRLIVDQDIEVNGVKMKTLGLAPHMVMKNLGKISDKQCDTIQEELMALNDHDNYRVEDYAASSPQDYAEMDRRSRFSIISTSPSLDPRIKVQSCVQIQHCACEMYLSYQSLTTFGGSVQNIVSKPFPVHEMKSDNAHGLIPDENLFYPVDDDDIQNGSRDPIELKPQKSNEDAFFILPERKEVLESILFIQTSIDNFKKYLPTICSRNLEISKDKQTKIFDLLDKVLKFLVGDSQDTVDDEDLVLGGGYSKDENDMFNQRRANLRLRQKLMRELYTVEALIHIIYLPFAGGDFSLDTVKGTDLIAKVCQHAYNLITLIGLHYYQNELYVSQWINLYFNHAMSTDES